MGKVHRLFGCASGALCLLVPGVGYAQAIVERTALSLDGTVLAVESVTIDTKNVLGEEISGSSTTVGLVGSGFGFGLGYGVSPSVLVGASLSIVRREVNLDLPGSPSTETSGYSIAPRVEYVFSEGQSFRPFLLARAGVIGDSTGSDDDETSLTQYFFGLGVGAHAFATKTFSIDPQLSFNFRTGTVHYPQPLGDRSTSGTSFLVSVAFTGWLGGPSPSHAVEEVPVPHEAAPETETIFEPEAGARASAPGPEPLQVIETLPEGHVVAFKARPEAAPDAVVVRLIEDARSSELLHCNDMQIVAGEERFELRRPTPPQRKLIANERRIVSETLTTPKAISALSQSPDSYIDICRERWSLTPTTRQAAGRFLTTFQQRGGKLGDPAAPPEQSPVPAPDQPAPDQPADPNTAPPAQGSTDIPATSFPVPQEQPSTPSSPPGAAPPGAAPPRAAPAKPPAPQR